MTPQEKAKELVEKFIEITPVDYTVNDSAEDVKNKSINDFKLCKQCALIAVDEILKNNCGSCMYESEIAQNYEIYCDEYYWQDVKDEIKKL